MIDTTRRVAAGAGWLYAYRWVERLLDFLSIVVLARLLAPDDFGLVAIAASLVTIVEGLSAFDVDRALIRSREDDRALYDTAWTLSALRGLVAALCMVGVSAFVTDARLSSVLQVLAMGPVVNGLRNPTFVTFERELVYSKLATLTLVAKVLSVGVMLGVAITTRNYWALVVGQIVYVSTGAVLSYALRPYRPTWSLARFPTLFAFSGWLSLTSLVTALSMETDKIIVGWLLGVRDAGLYFMVQRVGVLPTQELLSPLQRHAVPRASARWAAEPARLRRAVAESINVLGSLEPRGGLSASRSWRPSSSRWRSARRGRPSSRCSSCFVPYLGVRSTLSIALPCVLALGRTRLLFWVSFVYALVHVPAFIAGTALFGLAGAIGSLIGAGALYTWLNAWMLRTTVGLTTGDLLVQLRRPAAAAALMAGTVLGLTAFTPLGHLVAHHAGLSLCAKTLVGAAVFCGSHYALWRAEGRPAGIERRLAALVGR
jgi:lipopolysaccharide exporter